MNVLLLSEYIFEGMPLMETNRLIANKNDVVDWPGTGSICTARVAVQIGPASIIKFEMRAGLPIRSLPVGLNCRAK